MHREPTYLLICLPTYLLTYLLPFLLTLQEKIAHYLSEHLREKLHRPSDGAYPFRPSFGVDLKALPSPRQLMYKVHLLLTMAMLTIAAHVQGTLTVARLPVALRDTGARQGAHP